MGNGRCIGSDSLVVVVSSTQKGKDAQTARRGDGQRQKERGIKFSLLLFSY